MKTNMRKINGCPYKSSCNGACHHKKNHNRSTKNLWSKKTYCIYPNPNKCPIFVEWVEDNIKMDSDRVRIDTASYEDFR